MTTVDTAAIRRQYKALEAKADTAPTSVIAMEALALAACIPALVDALDDARREADRHQRTATLMADTLAMSERRPHRHPVESARVLGIVRGIAANMPQEDAADDEPEPTPQPPRLVTPGARRWWGTPNIKPNTTAVR